MGVLSIREMLKFYRRAFFENSRGFDTPLFYFLSLIFVL